MTDDVAFRLRLFARHPGLAGTAVLLLAVGLSTAGVGHDVFDAVTSPRVEGADRLARLGASSPVGLPGVGGLPGSLLRELQDATTSFSRIVAVDHLTGTLSDASGTLAPTRQVRVARATSGFFDLVGAVPLAGRVFEPDDYEAGGPGALILSDGLWRRWSGRAPSVLGRTVAVEGKDYVVIGVMPEGVRFPMADAWTALSEADLTEQGDKPVSMFAQLRPGGSWDAARTEIATIAPGMAALSPDPLRDRPLRLVTLREEGRSRMGVVAMGALGPPILLLLLSCLTVGNLALAEAVEREREVAVRLALGASRRRLARQFVTEALVLSAPAGVLALGLMSVELWLVRLTAPPGMQWFTDGLTIRPSTLVFVGAATCVTPFLFGLVPLAGSLRVDVSAGLRQAGRAPFPGLGHYTVRDLVVALQVALAVVVVATFAFMRGMISSAMDPELGFDQDELAIVRVAPEARADEETGGLRLLDPDGPLDRIRGLAGVDAATVVDAIPQPSRPTLTVASGRPSAARVASRRMAVGGDFFRTLHVPLLRGREITLEDCLSGRRVAVVSLTLARALWPGEDPVGQALAVLDDGGQPKATAEIVGVAPDLVYTALEPPSRHAVYVPFPATEHGLAEAYVLVRSHATIEAIAPAVATTLSAARRDGRPSGVPRPLLEMTEERLAEPRFTIDLLGAVGLLTLLLAVVGVVSVTVEAVRLNTRELGIRAALGARPGDLVRLVLKGAATKVALGIALGLPGPLVYHLSRPWAAVPPSAVLANPHAWALIGSTVLLIVGASWLAARGAAHADPSVSMRAE